MTTATGTFRPKLVVPGDWNGLFGLGTNVLLNVIVLTGLCPVRRGACPTTRSTDGSCRRSASRCRSATSGHAFLAYRLAKQSGRSDVTAMPYGPSVPHTSSSSFVVMLPIVLRGGTPIKAWHGRARVGVHRRRASSCIGAFIGPTIRQFTPRAAMLGTLAGISITFISMRPAFQMLRGPVDRARRVRDHPAVVDWPACGCRAASPAACCAVIVGTALGLDRRTRRDVDRDGSAGGQRLVRPVRRPPPDPGHRRDQRAVRDRCRCCVTAIPLGIYNFTEAMNNVESASAAGDDYNLRQVLLADGGRRGHRIVPRQPVPAGRLHRSSRLEGRRWADRLLAGDGCRRRRSSA